MSTHSALPCPVCHHHGVEFDESDKDGRCPVCGDVLENCPDWRLRHGLPSLRTGVIWEIKELHGTVADTASDHLPDCAGN